MFQSNLSKGRGEAAKQEFVINLQLDRSDRLYKFISTDTKVNLTPVAEQSIARRKALNKEIINQDSEDY